MPRNGSGVFTPSVNFVTEAAAPPIEISGLDAALVDIGNSLTASIASDGQTNPSASLPMNGFRHTGAGSAQALTDYATATDVIDQELTYYVDSGAVNAYEIAPSPGITSYVEGQKFTFRALNSNTSNSTLNVNGLGTRIIHLPDETTLFPGAIAAGGIYEVVYNASTSPDRWVMTSPHSLVLAIASRSMIAGAGLAGGGDLTGNRTFDIGGGTGMTIGADSIEVDLSTDWAWTGVHDFGGASNFNANANFNGTASFNFPMDVSETWLITSDLTPLSFNSQQNNYAPPGHATASVWRLSPTGGNQNISGIGGGVAGRRLQLFNISGNSFVLQDESASSIASNRIRTTGAGLTINEMGGCELWYDGTSSRWRIISNP